MIHTQLIAIEPAPGESVVSKLGQVLNNFETDKCTFLSVLPVIDNKFYIVVFKDKEGKTNE
jgi:hypothetical protein